MLPKQTPRFNRTIAFRVTGNVLMLAGFLCLCWVTGAVILNRLQERAADRVFRHNLALATAGALREQLPGDLTERPGGKQPLARLSIARLKVFGLVEEGFDSRTLSHAIGLRPNGPKPGQSGNIVLAAHRDRHFAGLKKARIGDEILLQTRDGHVYPYAITRIFVVRPSDGWVLRSSPGSNKLTLITCYPFRFAGKAPQRLIVQAEPRTAALNGRARSVSASGVRPATGTI